MSAHKDGKSAGKEQGRQTYIQVERFICLLDACQAAWVFGGMGSWNDMGFEGAEQTEYDRVSERLFSALNQTIQSLHEPWEFGRIMYIECMAGSLTGTARIGRVTFSKAGRTLYYSDQTFQSLKGAGFKSNYYCVETGEDYWISGPKRRGGDRLYGSVLPVEIDEEVRAEYWRDIRRQPERVGEAVA